jgi:hypothetical protein
MNKPSGSMLLQVGLVLVVAVQGAFLVSARRDLRTMNRRLESIGLTEAEEPAARPQAPAPQPAARPGEERRLPPPTFTVAATTPVGSAALSALGTAEGKQKLQEVLGAIKEEKRQVKMAKQSERRAQLDARMREIVGKELGLTPDEERKVQDVMAVRTEARTRAVEEMKSGLRTRQDAKKDIDTANQTAEQALKTTLGDQRMAKLRELGKREDKAMRGQPATAAAAPAAATAPGPVVR